MKHMRSLYFIIIYDWFMNFMNMSMKIYRAHFI